MFVHKVAGNWGGRQEWSDDTDPFTVFELYEQGNIYLYQYFCPLLGADTDIFHISQNLPFVHSRLRSVLGQLTRQSCFLFWPLPGRLILVVSLLLNAVCAVKYCFPSFCSLYSDLFNFWFGLKHTNQSVICTPNNHRDRLPIYTSLWTPHLSNIWDVPLRLGPEPVDGEKDK